ncbi:MAG: hypothetical protein KJO79_02635 [Verrucomicrobiae bacterium]|nr:hypothetical protein [Verrucomicrobiae bacterium]
MRILFSCLLGILAVLLNSCIDGEEEVFINADGSAKVKAVYRVPGILMNAQDSEELRTSITEEIARQKNLKLLTNRIDLEQGRRVLTIEIATDDVTALEGKLSDQTMGGNPSKADKILHAIIGKIVVNLDGLSAELTRNIDLKPLLDEYLGKNSASVLGESEFRYTVHLPTAVERSNAHEVGNGGRTLKWTYLLRDSQKRPMKLNMVARVPIPWWVYVFAVLVLVALVWSAYAFCKKRISCIGHGAKKDARIASSSMDEMP